MYSGAPRRSTCPSYLMKRPLPMNLVTGSRLAPWQRNASLRVSPAPAPSIPFLFFFGPQVFLIFNIFSNIRMSGNCFWQAVRHSLWDIWLFTTVWLSCSFVTFRQGKTGTPASPAIPSLLPKYYRLNFPCQTVCSAGCFKYSSAGEAVADVVEFFGCM